MPKSLTPPVSKDEVVDLLINDVGSKGDGIGFYDGFVIFVSGTRPGQKIRARVEKVFANCAKASLVEEMT